MNNSSNIYGRRLTWIEIGFIFLFPVLFRQFYYYISIPEVVCRLSVYGSVLATFAYTSNYLFLRKFPNGSIPQYVRWIFIAILISSVIAFMSREQGLILSYRALTGTFLGYIYFFVLYKTKPHPNVIIQLIFVYAAIYGLCYIWAIINAPTRVFVNTEREMDDSRGAFRIGVEGLQFMVLLFFYSVTNIGKSNKWIVLSVISYIFIILSLTRQVIALTLLIAGLFLVWKKKWLRYVVAIFAIFLLTLQNINLNIDDSSIIGSLINITTKQLEEQGDEDVRIRASKAFFFDFHQNIFEVIFGCSYMHVNSEYGRWEIDNFLNQGYYRSDVGYAGTYVTFGVFGLIVFLLLFYKAVTVKNVGIYKFAQLYIYYIAFANIASWSFRSNCIEISICLYLLTISAMSSSRSLKAISSNEILNNYPRL